MYPFRILVKISFILVTALILSWPANGQGAAMTIEEAIAEALKNNPDIEMARAGVIKAEAAVKKARSLFMPNLTLFSEYSGGDAPSAYLFKTIDQRKLPERINFNDPGEYTNLETGVMARWNLFSGGSRFLGMDMAEMGLDHQEAF